MGEAPAPAAAPVTEAPAPAAGAAVPAAAPPRGPTIPPRRFLRAFRRALTDEGTYDVRGNPSIWLGFLVALPIPFLMLAVEAPTWLDLLALFSPLTSAILMGAAGRVGILAEQERERLAAEVQKAHETQEELEEALDVEVERRKRLQERQREVISELKLAQSIQRTLVPDDIHHEAVDVSVIHLPSEYIGGDYLNTVVVDDRWAYLCIADVSGHGVAAALVVARVHGLVRRVTLQRRKPDAILERINRAAMTILKHTYFFMTFAVFRLDLHTGRLDYATAGHPGQLLLRADGRNEVLRTPNRLLGMDFDIFDATRPTDSTHLEPGDRLVLFTDGIYEILREKDGKLLGEQGLHRRIAELRELDPALMAGELLQGLAEFQGSSAFEDDVSLMIATYHGPASEDEDRIAGP